MLLNFLNFFDLNCLNSSAISKFEAFLEYPSPFSISILVALPSFAPSKAKLNADWIEYGEIKTFPVLCLIVC